MQRPLVEKSGSTRAGRPLSTRRSKSRRNRLRGGSAVLYDPIAQAGSPKTCFALSADSRRRDLRGIRVLPRPRRFAPEFSRSLSLSRSGRARRWREKRGPVWLRPEYGIALVNLAFRCGLTSLFFIRILPKRFG